MHPKKITLTILPMKIWWIEPIDMVYAMPMKGQHNLCIKVRKRHSRALNFAICWKEPPLEKASYAYEISPHTILHFPPCWPQIVLLYFEIKSVSETFLTDGSFLFPTQGKDNYKGSIVDDGFGAKVYDIDADLSKDPLPEPKNAAYYHK